jgi:hypothetical protein
MMMVQNGPVCKLCGYTAETDDPAEIMHHLMTHPEAAAEFAPLYAQLAGWRKATPDWSDQALDWYLQKTKKSP